MKHKKRFFNSLIPYLLCLTFLNFYCFAGETTETATSLNFPRIIQNAKDQIFPALIFVKPIVEEYSSGKKTQQEVFGSGVVISPDGYAVTNHHVIDKAISINCVLYDKRQVPVELVGSDKDTDLALLKLPVDEGQSMPYADFSTDPMIEGDFVMALGSPFGFQRSISLGIISNAQRYLGFESEYKYNTWLQTDAAINPGNSGGPLVNTEGKIVGFNTLGISGTGLGFSIPSYVVEDVVEQLKRDGKVLRATTGLRLQPLHNFHTNTFVDHEYGVLISGVEENSPAVDAGILAGDILLEINSKKLDGKFAETLPEIWRMLADLKVDQSAELKIFRAGKTLLVKISPEQKGKLEGDDFDCRRWNMTIKEINKYQQPKMYYMYGKGIFIQGLKYPGNAVESGLREGDVIVKVEKKAIKSVKQLADIYEQVIADQEREEKIMFEIKRNGLSKWIVLDYRKDYEEQD